MKEEYFFFYFRIICTEDELYMVRPWIYNMKYVLCRLGFQVHIICALNLHTELTLKFLSKPHENAYNLLLLLLIFLTGSLDEEVML